MIVSTSLEMVLKEVELQPSKFLQLMELTNGIQSNDIMSEFILPLS
jgi:hypothetical protein